MVPSTNRSGHRSFKAAMPGSNPAGITIFRIGVTAARLTLTQAVVVQIHDPEPQYSPVVQMANAPDCLSGDCGFESRRGCHTVPSSNRKGRQPLKLVMQGSNPAGITKNHRECAAGQSFPESAAQGLQNTCVVEMEYTSGLSPAAERIKGSTPFAGTICASGGNGRRGRLKPCYRKVCEFKSRLASHKYMPDDVSRR